MRFMLHFTLFSDGAKHHSFPVNFPRSYSRAKLINRKRSYWQMIGRIITRGGIVASNVCLQALSPLSLPFPCYFSPNREPVHRLVLVVMASIHEWFNLTCYHPPRGTPGQVQPGVGNCLKWSCLPLLACEQVLCLGNSGYMAADLESTYF